MPTVIPAYGPNEHLLCVPTHCNKNGGENQTNDADDSENCAINIRDGEVILLPWPIDWLSLGKKFGIVRVSGHFGFEYRKSID